MRYDASWINNVFLGMFLGIVYKKGSFIPLGLRNEVLLSKKASYPKRHPITIETCRGSGTPSKLNIFTIG